MGNIGFYLMQLIEDSLQQGERFVPLDADSFKDIPETFHTLVDNTYYEVSVQKHIDYIWFIFDFGNPSPRDENLTNINTGEKKDNPRKYIETELLKQLFCLYHYSKKILYLSNSKKQGLFKSILKEKLDTDYIVKNFYKTHEEFISLIKSIEEISFTEARNLFNLNSKERHALIDLTGTDAPDNFTITAKYSNTNRIKTFIFHLFEAKSKHSLNDLLIRGTDDRNFSVLFNNDTFSRKLNIQCAKDENGKFDTESVKEALLKVIEQ